MGLALTAAVTGREQLIARVRRFGRALIVGGGATVVDFTVLTSCIHLFGIHPAYARLPALVAGASVQFFGHRTFTFRAQAGILARQAKLFAGIELVGLLLNMSAYELLLPRTRVLPPEILSLLGSFLVFVCFAYPMHRVVTFALSPPPRPSEPRQPERSVATESDRSPV